MADSNDSARHVSPGPSQATSGQFQFINVHPGSARDHRRNNQIAHAHLAKLNRQKHHSGGRSRSEPTAKKPARSGHRTVGKPPLPSYHTIDLGWHEEAWTDSSPRGRLLGQAAAIAHASDPSKSDERDNAATGASESTVLDASLPDDEVESPARTLSPVLGAMQNCTLDCSTPAILAQTLDTKLNLTFPKYSKPFDISSRLKLFYQEPIIFHGFTVASAVHRDVLRNELCLSNSREIIAHKGKLLTLLNALLNNLADDDVELAILSIVLVTLADLDWYKLQGDPILPFRPHMASANWINVFGRVMSVDEERFTDHIRALATLTARRGGLRCLRLPGLGVQVAYQDLIGASRTISKPIFPSIWSLDDCLLAALRQLKKPCLGEELPGLGFQALASEGLPLYAVECLVLLSSIDRLLAECRSPSNLDHTSLVNARNTAQHQILSLPAWEELEDAEKRDTAPIIYECCRLTALLYSTAVIFGMPPQTNWHLKIVRQIRQLLELTDFDSWSKPHAPLLIWSLFVAGIAAYRSPERKFFEQALERVLRKSHLATWIEVERVIARFVWSDIACAHGAAVLWDALGVNEVSSYPSHEGFSLP